MKVQKYIWFFLPAFYLLLCLMKSLKNFEKIAILKIWQLVSFWGVKMHFGEKYAWFVIEILIYGSKSCLLDMLWSQKITKNLFRYNNQFWNYESECSQYFLTNSNKFCKSCLLYQKKCDWRIHKSLGFTVLELVVKSGEQSGDFK